MPGRGQPKPEPKSVAELERKTWAGETKADKKNRYKTMHYSILNTIFGSADHIIIAPKQNKA
jgi:hypothetical protein